VLGAERTFRSEGAVARVLVTLSETTTAGVQVVRGVTINEVRLRRLAGRWLVVGWTVIPAGAES
jgi:hypothetical protein